MAATLGPRRRRLPSDGGLGTNRSSSVVGRKGRRQGDRRRGGGEGRAAERVHAGVDDADDDVVGVVGCWVIFG